MKVISVKQTIEKVQYSRTHIIRLEKAGKFPARVRLGDHRVGYVEDEVDDWLIDKASKRSKKSNTTFG